MLALTQDLFGVNISSYPRGVSIVADHSFRPFIEGWYARAEDCGTVTCDDRQPSITPSLMFQLAERKGTSTSRQGIRSAARRTICWDFGNMKQRVATLADQLGPVDRKSVV